MDVNVGSGAVGAMTKKWLPRSIERCSRLADPEGMFWVRLMRDLRIGW